jgi:ketosteroid isomerase-like protein
MATDERKAVLEAERALYAAMVAGDRAALERMLSPSLVYVHSPGFSETRERYLAGVAKGSYEYESVRSRETRVRIHGDVALIDGLCEMRVGERGKTPESIELLFVLVWAKEGGAWRLLHRHAIRLKGR